MSRTSLADLIERLERNPSDVTLQGLLEEALRGVTDLQFLERLARAHFHSMEVGGPIMRRILALDPERDGAMAMLAGLYAMHIEIEPAREWAERALGANPKNVDALYAISQTHFEALKRLEIADQILAISPHEGRATRMKADALQRLGRHEEAADTWRRHVDWLKQSANPDASQIRTAEAGLAQAYEDPDAAARAIEKRVFGTDAGG